MRVIGQVFGRMSGFSAPLLITASLAVMVAASSVVALAGPASNSPFASKKKKAWEVQAPAQAPTQQQYQAPYQAQPYTPQQNQYGAAQAISPTGQSLQPTTPTVQTPSYGTQNYNAYNANAATSSAYGSSAIVPAVNQPVQIAPQQPSYMPSTNYGNVNQGNSGQTLAGGQYQSQNGGVNPSWAQTPNWAQQQRGQYGAQQNNPNSSPYAMPARAANGRDMQAKKPWYQRLGLGKLNTDISGKAKAGVAFVDGASRSGGVETMADVDVRAEVSALSDGGLEYGVGLRARAQRDRNRRGFGGRIGDCPSSNSDCASTMVDGTNRAIKGHTSGFYTEGVTDSDDFNTSLEGAYVFLRSAYGDVVLGRDDGAAYLFSLGAPSLVAVAGSNSGVDYTGLDSVKTVNDASGFAEKISYTSPRLLGDQVGVGVQVGFSYAPNARACGVNYCVRKNTASLADAFAPDMKDIFEAGISLDRKFNSGISTELTATYARGSEASGNDAFDNLSAFGVGLEMKYNDIVFGTSWLKSNNGIAQDGDYTAYDVGITWQPSSLGFSASYGHAKDDLVNMTSDQAVLAMSYDFGQKRNGQKSESPYRIGAGLQYANRKSPYVEAGSVVEHSEDALALFIEGRVKF